MMAKLCGLNSCFEALSGKLESYWLLAIRLYMANVFLASGWSKLQNALNGDWSSTVYLFQEIHPVPVLPAELAAIMGTGGELVFGGLLLVGLLGRYAALGLIGVTLVIELAWRMQEETSYTAQHLSWALLLAAVWIRGAGCLSLDKLLMRWCGSKSEG